jgi:uncharacterized repeat protein (TIGR01451 family)
MKKTYIVSFLCIFLASIAFAGTVNLPQTGQTKCYDSLGNEISCTGTGQDGEIRAGVAWPNPRFTDNGDDTILDNLTGLMWTKDANLPGAMLTWQDGLDYVAGMNAGTYPNFGYTDWCLPNVDELESLINADEAKNATWLSDQGFINVQANPNQYWSSTTDAYNTSRAWIIDMELGFMYSSDKLSSYAYNVWPVRAGQLGGVVSLPQTGQRESYTSGDDGDLERGITWPSPRFTDHLNGTVADNLTGLMWTRDANILGGCTTWQGALDYLVALNTGIYPNFGYTDWRLPNRKELHSLTDFSRYSPALPSGHPFINVQGAYYWSSTSSVRGAWVVAMWIGYLHAHPKSDIDFCYYVWPVRTGQVGQLGNSDISVSKSDSPDPVTVGNNLTYTITVTNNGPDTATGVTLIDTLPSSVTYVSATSTQGSCTKTGNTVTCNIGTLSNGSSATVTIAVAPTAAGTITNTATVTCNETDTNSANNTATTSTTVNASPTGCSTWSDVIGKYNAYVNGQASWMDVIACYQEYVSSQKVKSMRSMFQKLVH